MKKQTLKKVPQFNLIIRNQKRETKTLKNVPQITLLIRINLAGY